MAIPRPNLIKTNCERCGKILYTTSESILKRNDLKESFPCVCEGCATPDEKQEINKAVLGAFITGAKK